MKNCLAIVFSFLFATASGQELFNGRVLKGRVTDQNNNGLAYVNAGIVNTTYGTVTGTDGSFEIYITDEVPGNTDTVKFSMIGYESSSISFKEISNDTNFRIHVILKEKTYQIKPVEVSSTGLERVVEGNSNITTTMSNNMAISGLPGQNLGAEVGRKFFFHGKTHQIEKLNFYIKYCNYDTVVFRVNVYEVEHGKPGRNISGGNLVFTVIKHRKGWIAFDLSPYKLTSSENVIVSLEWVGHSQKGTLLGFPITVPSPGAVHYYKFGSQSQWKKFISMSTAMNIEALREP